MTRPIKSIATTAAIAAAICFASYGGLGVQTAVAEIAGSASPNGGKTGSSVAGSASPNGGKTDSSVAGSAQPNGGKR